MLVIRNYSVKRSRLVILKTNQKKNLWQNFVTGNLEFERINSEEHVYFVNDCEDIIYSPDSSVFLIREVLFPEEKESYDYMEAPFVAFNNRTQNYAMYVNITDYHIRFFSRPDKGEFINGHDCLFDGNTYFLVNDYLKKIPQLIKNREVEFKMEDIKDYLIYEELSEQNIVYYNDIAYYLEQSGNYEVSTYLLEKIIVEFPDRVVAHLNIADAYWGNNEKEEARKSYQKYIKLMQIQGKDMSKIPQRVYDRIK